MYKVNITDGNVSSVIDDLSLIQSAGEKNVKDIVKTIFSKPGLILSSTESFACSKAGNKVIISNVGPIVFADGYISSPASGSITALTSATTPVDVYLTVKKSAIVDNIINDIIEVSTFEVGTAPTETRAIRLYEINTNLENFIVKDYRDENAAKLERNPTSTAYAPIISSITTSYNYDDIVAGRDFSLVDQRIAFLKIDWVHFGQSGYIVRICPCNENGIEQRERAEYIYSLVKSLTCEVIDGKKYSVKVRSKNEEGTSDWSDVVAFVAGSDRKADAITPPQVKATVIKDYPTTVAINVTCGTRGIDPYYIEVYKNDKLLYTGAAGTVVSILEYDETAFYKARVKGPNELASAFVATGSFTGTFYNANFSGDPADLVLSIPITVSETLKDKRTSYSFPVRSVMFPRCEITKITFDSKGSYCTAASTPVPVISIRLSMANVGTAATINVSDIFAGVTSSLTTHLNYYKFFKEDGKDTAADPGEAWSIYVNASSSQDTSTLNLSGTLNIHYKPKHGWQA